MWMKAGQVAPGGPRGRGSHANASLMSRLRMLPISESNTGVRAFRPFCLLLLEQIPPGIFNCRQRQRRGLRFTACRLPG